MEDTLPETNLREERPHLDVSSWLSVIDFSEVWDRKTVSKY